MGSVASWAGASTAGNYVLTFNTTPVPTSWVDSFRSTFERATPVNVRQNLWGSSVILDGTYPAYVWRHEFLILSYSGSLGGIYQDYLDLFNMANDGVPRELNVVLGDTTTPFVSFGPCYIENVDLEEPADFLTHPQALFRVRTIGSTIPTRF